MASENELGPMEAALLYIMSSMALKDEKKLVEGFLVEELSQKIHRSPARTRALLSALKSKGYVSDVERYDPETNTVMVILGMGSLSGGIRGQGEEEISELEKLRDIIGSPRGGIRKRWFLRRPPEECLKAAREALEKYTR